jgi:3-phenylpropionate/cinnamic acid dioxygenase small subunit
MLDVADTLAIHQLLAIYGHLIDERQWSRLGEVFTPDAVFDATDFGLGVTHSLDELRDAWTGPNAAHPLAHHATNIVITEDADGVVRVLSKVIGVGNKGRVGSGTYRDVVVNTPDGWRLASRTVTLRHPDRIPDPS